MDPRPNDLILSVDDFDFEGQVPAVDPNQTLSTPTEFKSNKPIVGSGFFAVPLSSVRAVALNNMPTISVDGLIYGELAFSTETDGGSFYPSVSPGKSLNVRQESLGSSDDINSSDPVLKYISQMLMEENMEDEVWISPDDFALQNTEKLLYDALGEQLPNSPDKLFIESSNSSLSKSRTDRSRLHDQGEYNKNITSAVHCLDQVPELNTHCSSPFHVSSLPNSTGDPTEWVESSIQVKVEDNINDNYSVIQFMRGLEEASKFLPPSSQLDVNFENVGSGSGAKRGTQEVDVHSDNSALSGPRGKRNHEREDPGCLIKARATKQIASHVEAEEAEFSDMFDKVLLCTEKADPLCPTSNCLPTDASEDLQKSAPLCGSDGGRGQGSDSSVDLRALLMSCARTLSANDLRTANDLLKQIRENSSPSGNGSQRLAHYFANGLEARMEGNHCGTQSFHASFTSKRRSVVDLLKATQLHISSSPFKRFSIFYMTFMLLKLSQRATILHIIDFGIGFGFQWPILIQKLGEQAGGPPKLRITGVELPQPGFRPTEKLEETGRHLARYCKRFNVPFEYNALPSQNWEAIKIEDLVIRRGEIVAVTCLVRFENLLDEEDSPRDTVLNLIRSIRPAVFVHAINNGSYSSPFFITRFRQLLFHMSSIYDMYDTAISGEHRDSKERTILESDCYGREIMNAIACEGSEKIERPETYKQWQVRHVRAGFKQIPLDQTMMKEFRHKLEAWYHEDFVLDEDGDWMLLGWKGRILNATTCLVPR